MKIRKDEFGSFGFLACHAVMSVARSLMHLTTLASNQADMDSSSKLGA